jgi:hypothetical protein
MTPRRVASVKALNESAPQRCWRRLRQPRHESGTITVPIFSAGTLRLKTENLKPIDFIGFPSVGTVGIAKAKRKVFENFNH